MPESETRTEAETLILHEAWETHDAQAGYTLSPLATELASVWARDLSRDPMIWEVEDVI